MTHNKLELKENQMLEFFLLLHIFFNIIDDKNNSIDLNVKH